MSHLCSPLGSLSRFDKSIPTSAISLYLKLGGHEETVAIHSLKQGWSDMIIRHMGALTSLRDQSRLFAPQVVQAPRIQADVRAHEIFRRR